MSRDNPPDPGWNNPVQEQRVQMFVSSAQAALHGTHATLRELLSETSARHEVFLWKFALIAEQRGIDSLDHMMRVGQMSGLLALEVSSDYRFARLVCQAAPHHDVGKICIPDHILRRNPPLSDAEMQLWCAHPALGARLLCWPDSDLLRLAEQIALHHHERFDGAGYPAGLAGYEVPLCARIVAVADQLEELTRSKGPDVGLPMDGALRRLEDEAGTRFDPAVVEAALNCQRELVSLQRVVDLKFNGRQMADMDHRVFRPIF